MSSSSTTTVTTKSPQELAEELGSALEQVPISKVNPQEAEKEEQSKLDDEQQLNIRKLTAEVEKFEQDNEGRRVLRDAIFIVTLMWMGGVMFTIWKIGIGVLRLSDTVLVALITTTTANVFGFLYVVVNYLYNKDKST